MMLADGYKIFLSFFVFTVMLKLLIYILFVPQSLLTMSEGVIINTQPDSEARFCSELVI